MACGRFIATVIALVPQVFDSLKSDLLQAWDGCWPPLLPEGEVEAALERWRGGGEVALTAPPAIRFPELHADLLRWADGYNIAAPWILKLGWNALYWWSETPRLRDEPGLPLNAYLGVFPEWSLPSDDALLVSINTRWWATVETRADAKKRIAAMVDGRFDEIELSLAQLGYDVTPRRAEVHFAWFVRWQCCGWSMSKIHRTYRKNPKNLPFKYVKKRGVVARGNERELPSELDNSVIAKALRDTAELLGLTLRRGKPGPPPKNPGI